MKIHLISGTCLALVLSVSATNVNATTIVISADEVRIACDKAAACKAEFPKLSNFCDLTTKSSVTKTDWDKVTVPTIDDLRETGRRECKAKGAPQAGSSSLSLQSLGTLPLNQSAILWGATDFLLGRAQEELDSWAIDRLQAIVCDDGKYAKFPAQVGEPLFPASCTIWKGTKLQGLMGGMATFQAAMRKDFANIPPIVFKGIVDSERGSIATYQRQLADPKEVAKVGLGNLQTSIVKAKRVANASATAFEFSKAISALLLGSAPLPSVRQIAIDGRQVTLDLKDEPLASGLFILSAYLGGFSKGSDGDLQLPKKGAVMPWIYAAMALAVNAEDPLSLKSSWPTNVPAAKIPFDVEMVFGLREAILEVGQRIADLSLQLKNAPVGIDPNYRLQIYASIAESVISEMVSLASKYLNATETAPEIATVLQAIKQIAHDAAAANFGTVVLDVTLATAEMVSSEVAPVLPPEFARVLSFGADIAQAPTADAATAAIKRFASPVGSYRRKRLVNEWYGRLNAYAGGGAFVEAAKVRGRAWNTATGGFSPSFWMPIGLELGHGDICGTSLGLFVQAVDLGVLASWRIGGDSSSTAPEVGFKQVFSPGAYAVWGAPGAPLTFALGGEIAPSLRSLTQAGMSSSLDAYRFGLTVAIDIPIFP